MDLKLGDRQRKHIVVLSAYRFWPVQDGGHQRNWNLYVELEEKFDVTVVAIDWVGESKFSETEAGSQLIAFSPPSEVIVSARLLAPQVGFHSWDMLTTLFSQHFNQLDHILGRLNKDTDLVILSRPWLLPLLLNFPKKPVILDLHDIETDFTNDETKVIQEFTTNLQFLAMEYADAVTLCSQRDLNSLSLKYSEKYAVIPNGFQKLEASSIKPAKKCGVIFVGSGHKPNVDACHRLFKIAKLLPAFHFQIIGSVSKHPELSNPPSNVELLGFLEIEDLRKIFENALCFANPMDGGSGSSLKVAQALSFGLPIVSTHFGMRGFEALSSDSWLHAETDSDFALEVENLSRESEEWIRISRKSKEESNLYDWKNIRKDFAQIADNLLLRNVVNNCSDLVRLEIEGLNRELRKLSSEAIDNLNKDVKSILRNRYNSLPEWQRVISRKLIRTRFVHRILRKSFKIFLSFLKLVHSWDVKTAIARVNSNYGKISEKKN